MSKVKLMEKQKDIVILDQRIFMPPVESAKTREWHNHENKVRAITSLECAVHAEINNMPSQVALHKADAMNLLNRDRAEEADFVAQSNGIDSKLFAVHDFEDKLVPFTVKSRKFDWEVLPMAMTDERVPHFALERATFLKSKGIRPDFWAMAVPGTPNYLPTGHNAREETKKVLRQVGRMGLRVAEFAFLAGKVAGKAAVVAGSAVGTAIIAVMPSQEAWDAFLNDPVLLACFGLTPCYLIEIGRWD